MSFLTAQRWVRVALTLGLYAACIQRMEAHQAQQPPLTPGETPPTETRKTQPGKVGSGDSTQSVQTDSPTQQPQAPAPLDPNAPVQTPMTFQSHGLDYDALTTNGITVMFAEMAARLKEFHIIQVTVTNGSLVSWTVRPSDFEFLRSDGSVLVPLSADQVVAELYRRADRDDVIKLQLMYENSIYDLSSYHSTSGYEKRRQAAMAQFVNRGFKAAAEASALAFVPTKLKPGDSTDGAIFFVAKSKEKSLGAGRLIARTCGETLVFETFGELKKR